MCDVIPVLCVNARQCSVSNQLISKVSEVTGQ